MRTIRPGVRTARGRLDLIDDCHQIDQLLTKLYYPGCRPQAPTVRKIENGSQDRV
jgi:hypothetical protein